MTRPASLILSVLALSLLASCTSVTKAGPDQITIDTGDIGSIVPAARPWLAQFEANDHCGLQGKEAKLVDLIGSAAIYRCVAKK